MILYKADQFLKILPWAYWIFSRCTWKEPLYNKNINNIFETIPDFKSMKKMEKICRSNINLLNSFDYIVELIAKLPFPLISKTFNEKQEKISESE